MEEKKDSYITTIILGISALFFYMLCWFIDQPSKALWYIGVGLPWLSLIVGLLLSFASNKELSWAYCYILSAIMFVVFVSIKKNDILSQIPYLASCVCFIAYARFSVLVKDFEESKSNKTRLKEQNKTLKYKVQSLKSELALIKKETTKIISDQKKYDNEIDEVILLARNKVMNSFCYKLLNNIEEYEKMDRDLYYSFENKAER